MLSEKKKYPSLLSTRMLFFFFFFQSLSVLQKRIILNDYVSYYIFWAPYAFVDRSYKVKCISQT